MLGHLDCIHEATQPAVLDAATSLPNEVYDETRDILLREPHLALKTSMSCRPFKGLRTNDATKSLETIEGYA